MFRLGIPAGQCHAGHFGQGLCILEKCLVEVAHSKQQQRTRMAALDLHVLGQHGRQLGSARGVVLVRFGGRFATSHESIAGLVAGAGQVGHDDLNAQAPLQLFGLAAGKGGIDEVAGADLVEELSSLVPQFINAQIR